MPALLLLALSLGADPTSESVELTTATGTLYGTFDLPAGKGPWPVVLIHAGSGPTDRDGNQARLKNDSLKLLGKGLAEKGFACLRFDKRGVAASAKAMTKEEDLRVTTFTDDILGWVKLLRADKRFTKIGFVGHSEGSFLGSLVPQAKFDAFVSLCGLGRKFGVTVREQLKKNLSAELYEKSDAVFTALEAGKTVTDPPKELAALFRPSVQPYLISVCAPDPATELAKHPCPILVVSGTTDIQVNEADYKPLLGCRKGVIGVRVENLNHILREVKTTEKLPQTLSYVNAKQPLHPKLVSEIVAFLTTAFVEK